MRVIDTSFDRSDDLQWANVNLRIAFVNVQQYYNIERRLEADPHYQLVGAHEV